MTAVYINLYRPLVGSCGHVYSTREFADQMAGRDRIACVEVLIDGETAAKMAPREEGEHA